MSNKPPVPLAFPCHHNHPCEGDQTTVIFPMTGACGIHCGACRLQVLGVCHPCAAGIGEAKDAKMAAQVEKLGHACPILACAAKRGVAYCPRDCADFPCEIHQGGPFPYSEGFLAMQHKRRVDLRRQAETVWPDHVEGFWQSLEHAPAEQRAQASEAEMPSEGVFDLESLNEAWRVDVPRRLVTKVHGAYVEEWDKHLPFLLLVFLNTSERDPGQEETVPPRDLFPGKDFFKGKYQLHPEKLERAYGEKPKAFLEAGLALGGTPLSESDAGFRLWPLPKIPVDFQLWVADEEFPAKVSLLVGRQALRHFPPDALAMLMTRLIDRLESMQVQG